jgi:patatin-like phospholipase/acyl hydrolase
MSEPVSTFRILSLDGGGIRGAFEAAVLAVFEEKLQRPVSDYFDLIAGTSTGAIVAAALAAGKPAQSIIRFYVEQGANVFHERDAYRSRGWVRPFFPLVSKVFRKRTGRKFEDLLRARFCPFHLEEAFTELFGDATMASLDRARVVIPTVNLTDGQTRVFRTPHLPDWTHDGALKITDVLRATTAAPTYFPHKEMPDGRSYCDGGLWANTPSILALAEAMKIGKLCTRETCDPSFEVEQIRVCSIGTGRVSYSLCPPGGDAGALYWSQHAAEVMIISQTQGIQSPLDYFLGDRYHHINFDLPDASWTLDAVQHVDALLEMGRTRGEEEFEKVAETFFREATRRYRPFTA